MELNINEANLKVELLLGHACSNHERIKCMVSAMICPTFELDFHMCDACSSSNPIIVASSSSNLLIFIRPSNKVDLLHLYIPFGLGDIRPSKL